MRLTSVLWRMWLVTFMFIALGTIMEYTSIGTYVLLGCILGLLLWYWIGWIVSDRNRRRRSQDTPMVESEDTTPTRTHIVIASGPRDSYWQDLQLLSFNPKAHMARLAMRALPPVTSFHQTSHSQRECPICMEDFKDGELIQPFAVCAHEFHSSCVNSWLLTGKTTCPVCREDLSIITIH